MLNINGKVLDDLDANEYYLLSILLNYGKKCKPDNDVLLYRTKWGLQKLQKVKKALIKKGYITSTPQFKNQERGRSSNLYTIKSNLVSKYNGIQLNEIKLVEIQLLENKLVEIQLQDFKLVENQTGFNVLKYSIIENIKLLINEKESTPPQEIIEIESLELKKQDSKEKEKNSAKKEKEIVVPPTDYGYQANKKRNAKQKNGSWSQLDINLHSYKENLPQEWSKGFTETVLDYWYHLEEKKGVNWGTVRTLKAQVTSIIDHLKKFTEEQIIESFQESIKEGWGSYNPEWTENRKKKAKDEEQERANNGKPKSKFGKFGKNYVKSRINNG